VALVSGQSLVGCGVFAVKKKVKPSLLWDSAFASASGVAAVALLCGVLVATSGVSSLLLIGDSVHLGLLRFGRPESDCAGMTHVLLDRRVSLGFRCDSTFRW
jgi:hypothetical protein